MLCFLSTRPCLTLHVPWSWTQPYLLPTSKRCKCLSTVHKASILGSPGSQLAFVSWYLNHIFLHLDLFPQEGELLEFRECVLSPSVLLPLRPASGIRGSLSEHGNGWMTAILNHSFSDVTLARTSESYPVSVQGLVLTLTLPLVDVTLCLFLDC